MTIGAAITCCSLIRLLIQPTAAFRVPEFTFLAIIVFVEELLDSVLDNVVIDIDILLRLALICCNGTLLGLQVVRVQ